MKIMKVKVNGARLFERFDCRSFEQKVEDELRFHFELQMEENLRQGMKPERAKAEALKRFGNIELIKNQCVAICKRRSFTTRSLRLFLVVIFAVGISVLILGTDVYGRQIGKMLMTIAALGGLLIYIRSVGFSDFTPEEGTSLPLRLSVIEQESITTNGDDQSTPLERLING